MTAVRAILALGSNLGERADTLSAAVAELAAHPAVELLRASPVAATGSISELEISTAVATAVHAAARGPPYRLATAAASRTSTAQPRAATLVPVSTKAPAVIPVR